jgi:hypothetical protein
MQTPAFDCYICTASIPDEGNGWPEGWAVCEGFRAACPSCVTEGRAIPIGQKPAPEPAGDVSLVG